jgi:hypothetical protein
LTGKLLSLVDPPSDAAHRKLDVKSGDTSIALSGPATAGDPTAQGATLQLVNPTTNEQATIALPAAGWKASASSYQYRDSTLSSGPCKTVVLRKAGTLAIQCRGPQLGFTLDEPSQGALALRLTIGPTRYCMRFGGEVKTDVLGRFKASTAPRPASCL